MLCCDFEFIHVIWRSCDEVNHCNMCCLTVHCIAFTVDIPVWNATFNIIWGHKLDLYLKMFRNANYWYMLPVKRQEVHAMYFLALRKCPPATLMPALILLKIFLSSWYSLHLLLFKNCLSIISLFLTWRLRRSQLAACMPCAEFTQKFCHWEICSVDTVLCEMIMSSLHSFIHSFISWRIVSGLIECTGQNLIFKNPGSHDFVCTHCI